jgi:tetratricopeptide (TPR) repeat protein
MSKMMLELTLSFSSIDLVTVKLNDRTTNYIPFTSPLTKADWEDMQWYLEAYPTQYAADVDDSRAERIVAKLKVWGQGLFNAVFADRAAERLFNEFQDENVEGRQISIAASQPEILRLPWELLCDPSGTYLVHEQPRIALRRQLAGAGGGRKPIEVKPKTQLRLLMVVSRPDGAGFIDPRSEAQVVLQAIERSAPGRVVVEFLRLATLTNLVERLENRQLPAVDILHFDGHGVFDGGTGTGYLLFEDEDGKKKLVSAEELGEVLHSQQISLIVLSACQSAMVTGDDALGCVAARLAQETIPAVLAMTYSVLVTMTEQLFGKFYEELAGGKSLGVALANARRDLYERQQRGKTWRGTEQVKQNLSDWFLPAWYQTRDDIQLLQPSAQVPLMVSPRHNLRHLAKEGFFGRIRDLWDIERAFLKGKQRFTISGFGGQGKTYLALEIGWWLSQKGMFDAVCFVDYSSFQGVDPVGFAVSEIGVVLEQSFLDAAAVTAALEQQRTLLILDNLESLEAEALQELLTVAKEWSEVGATRLLLTTRNRDLNHPDYPVGRSLAHQRLLLKGLGDEQEPEDAINYFQALMKLPPMPKWELPERSALIDLFKLVDFHPLSIKLVAYQCKDRKVGDLALSLAELVAAEPQADKQRCLIASLNLSLQRLDGDLLELLLRLGVFQGGAFESDLLNILEFDPQQWQRLKSALVYTGLVHVEMLENMASPFLRFHPTLTPVLWSRLSLGEQRDLKLRHHFYYYFSVFHLYDLDDRNPAIARSAVRKDLPNLLWAVKGALNENNEYVASFVELLNRFLSIFGLNRDRMLLTAQISQLPVTVGSRQWYLINADKGNQLRQNGQYASAAKIFAEILRELDPQPSFDRVSILILLVFCLKSLGQLSEAAQYIETALSLCEQLEQSAEIKIRRGILQTELGDMFTGLGKLPEAQRAYSDAFATNLEIGNQRQLVVIAGQLAAFALKEGDLTTALNQYKLILRFSQQLQEPDLEATAWHQLGMVHEKGKNWTAADRSYRESARISEQYGILMRAANAYSQLAVLNQNTNNLPEAEKWYLKTLEIDRVINDDINHSKTLCNYAYFLANQQNCLLEAHQLAIEALAIRKTLDPATGLLWSNYSLLAIIATAQGETDKAKEYRQLARTAKAAFAGTQYELQQHESFIAAVAAAVGDKAAQSQLEPILTQKIENGRGQLVAVIRRVLAGERDIEVLWDDLDVDDSMIIAAILGRV